jgi:hypothetical protein
MHVDVTPSSSSKSMAFLASTTAAGPEVAVPSASVTGSSTLAVRRSTDGPTMLPTNKCSPCTFRTTIGAAVCASALPITRRDTTLPSTTNSTGKMVPSTRTTKRVRSSTNAIRAPSMRSSCMPTGVGRVGKSLTRACQPFTERATRRVA